ncbi:MAG TPA: glycosyltransferase family 2 protein [Bryobacteraceae bacterium]|nr:glycosyltransferase family 2 protein [Bryobacteraceae bacterium]
MEEFPGLTVSVVVVTWNRRDLLRSCLQSLTRQQLKQPFEVVVVDNGSDDGSEEMALREFSSQETFRLKLIRNPDNRGFCAANNQGFAASNSELIALLNNDAEAEPGWLQALSNAFESGPEIGMAASKILVYEDPRRIDKVGHLIYPDGQNRGRGSGEIDHGQYDRVEEVLWPDGCAAMYRRKMLDEIGGFDEDFFAYADDAELGLRARIAGWNCLYVPSAVVRHRRGTTLGVRSSRRIELIERNRVLLAAKLFPWSLLWLNGAYFLARVLASLWAAMRNRGEVGQFPGMQGKIRAATALLMGDLKALTLLPAMLKKRRRVNQIRKLSPREVRNLILSHRIPLKQLTEQAI